MARSIWSGNISFGLVNIPVKLYPAVRSKQVGFHLLHQKDKVRLQQKLVCPAEQQEVPRQDTVKGYEIGPDQLVVVEPEELQALAPKASRTIEVSDFVPLEQIDSLFFEQPYYLLPGERALKAYMLFFEALKRSKKVGIGTFVMRNKQYLGALRALEGLVCLETMHYADELVSPEKLEELPEKTEVNPRELKMAEQLIESLSGDFQPEKYRDTYRESVLELIDRKAEGKQVVVQPPVAEKPQVIDLMSALEASLEEAKRKRRKSA